MPFNSSARMGPSEQMPGEDLSFKQLEDRSVAGRGRELSDSTGTGVYGRIVGLGVEALSESVNWKSMLASFSRSVTKWRPDICIAFVVMGKDMKFKWSTHAELLAGGDIPYEDLLPLKAEFLGDRTAVSADSGIKLIAEISAMTGISEFVLFRGGESVSRSLYMYVGCSRNLSEEEESAFSLVNIVFGHLLGHEISATQQAARSMRLAAVVEALANIHDGTVKGGSLNRIADLIQKWLAVDYVAITVEEETGTNLELAGMSETLTSLYDTPQSLKLGGSHLFAGYGLEAVTVSDFGKSGYRPLASGSKWAALIPVDTGASRRMMMILESESQSPFDEAEMKEISLISRAIGTKIALGLSIAEREKRMKLRDLLLEELLLLQREGDPVKIAEEILNFIDTVIHANISVFYILDQSRSMLIPIQSHGIFSEEMLSYSVRIGEGIVGRAISRDKPELIHDAHTDARSVNIPGTPNEPESILSIPIRTIKEDIGVIALHRIGRRTFSGDEMEMAEVIAKQFSAVIERTNSFSELKKTLADLESEKHLRVMLAEYIRSAADERSIAKLADSALELSREICMCGNGMLLLRVRGEQKLHFLAGDRHLREACAPGVSSAGFDSALKNTARLATRTHIIENAVDIDSMEEILGLSGEGAGHPPPVYNMLIHESEEYRGHSVVLVGFDFRTELRKELFRNAVTQELLDFLTIRMTAVGRADETERRLGHLQKMSDFKDSVNREYDTPAIYMTVASAMTEKTGAAFAAVYSIDYERGILAQIASSQSSYQPPKEILMKTVPGLAEKLNGISGTGVIDVNGDESAFHDLFSNKIAVSRLKSVETPDAVILTGFRDIEELNRNIAFISEASEYLEGRIRQLETVYRERQNAGLTGIIDDVGRKIASERNLTRMLDSLASAAGHIIGCEYSLTGVVSSSYIEWNGFFETRIPETIDRLAIKTAESGETIIVNNFTSSQIDSDPNLSQTVRDMLIFPVFKKTEGGIPILVLLLNKFEGRGFTEKDIWILDKLSANIVSSVRNMEMLRKESQLKRNAESVRNELLEILNEMEFPIIKVDASGNIEFANSQAEKLLLPDSDSEELKIIPMLDEKDSLQVVEFIDNLKRGEKFDSTYTFVTPSGTRRFSVSGIPIHGKGKRKGTILMLKQEQAQVAMREGGTAETEEQLSTRHAEIEGIRYSLRRGYIYLVGEQRPDVAYLALSDLSKAGFDILAITRQHPTKLREKYSLNGAEIRWLTQVVGSNNLDPSKLSMITGAVLSFIDRHDNSAVFLDGLEYLLSNNSIVRVIGMIENIMQKAVDRGAVVIVSADRLTFEQKDLAIIEKLFEQLDAGDMKRRYLNADIERFGRDSEDRADSDANR